jgi:hypothetical protein
MVGAYWQQPLLQADIARWLGTHDSGTPSSRIHRLSRYGFDVDYGESSLAGLAVWLEQRSPVILFVRTGDLPYWSSDSPHAVVLAGLEGNYAILFDPGMPDGPQSVLIGDLLIAWSPFDYLCAVLRPVSSV